MSESIIPNDQPAPIPLSECALVNYLDGLVAQLRAHAAGVLNSGAAESIHQARVATRRLKAATELLQPILSDGARKRFNKLTRRIRRRLGALRDMDVMAEHMADLATEDAAAAPAGAWMNGQLEQDRLHALASAKGDRALIKLESRLEVWQKLRRQIELHADAIDLLLSESLHAQLEAFASSAETIDHEDATHDPHVVRIAGKALRYTVEMAQVQGHALSDAVNKSFKKMQDALGTWHDHVVLTEDVMGRSVAAMLAHHDSPTQHSVLALAGVSLREADRQLDKFKRLWHEDGATLTEAIRTAFPLSRDVGSTESKTDPDPSDSTSPPVPDGPH